MLGSTDEIQFFQLILKSINAKQVLELGTYTGYTTMSLAMALPDDGKVVSCDITDQSIQYDIWKEAGVDQKIELKLGSAIETLDNMINNGENGSFDFAFIDADKNNYINYYERCLKLVRKVKLIFINQK
jgi:predicted O-methyltransferase YrrM